MNSDTQVIICPVCSNTRSRNSQNWSTGCPQCGCQDSNNTIYDNSMGGKDNVHYSSQTKDGGIGILLVLGVIAWAGYTAYEWLGQQLGIDGWPLILVCVGIVGAVGYILYRWFMKIIYLTISGMVAFAVYLYFTGQL